MKNAVFPLVHAAPGAAVVILGPELLASTLARAIPNVEPGARRIILFSPTAPMTPRSFFRAWADELGHAVMRLNDLAIGDLVVASRALASRRASMDVAREPEVAFMEWVDAVAELLGQHRVSLALVIRVDDTTTTSTRGALSRCLPGLDTAAVRVLVLDASARPFLARRVLLRDGVLTGWGAWHVAPGNNELEPMLGEAVTTFLNDEHDQAFEVLARATNSAVRRADRALVKYVEGTLRLLAGDAERACATFDHGVGICAFGDSGPDGPLPAPITTMLIAGVASCGLEMGAFSSARGLYDVVRDVSERDRDLGGVILGELGAAEALRRAGRADEAEVRWLAALRWALQDAWGVLGSWD